LKELKQLTSKQLLVVSAMHLAFAVAAGLAFYFAGTGNLSLACPQHATSCVKIDNWKMSGRPLLSSVSLRQRGGRRPRGGVS
jgi:hypothetical protein